MLIVVKGMDIIEAGSDSVDWVTDSRWAFTAISGITDCGYRTGHRQILYTESGNFYVTIETRIFASSNHEFANPQAKKEPLITTSSWAEFFQMSRCCQRVPATSW